MSLRAKISTVLEFGLHTGIHSPMQKWHRDLVLITVTLLGSADYLRAVTVHQHSLKKLADGVRHKPELSPPSPNGGISLIPGNTDTSSPNCIRPSVWCSVGTNYCWIIGCYIGHSFVLNTSSFFFFCSLFKQRKHCFLHAVLWQKTQAWAELL